MEQVQEHINQLRQKLTQLLASYQQQKGVIAKLQQENEKLKAKQPLKQQQPVTPDASTMQALVQNLGTDTQKQELKKTLATYMTHLDKCIAFLEKQCTDVNKPSEE